MRKRISKLGLTKTSHTEGPSPMTRVEKNNGQIRGTLGGPKRVKDGESVGREDARSHLEKGGQGLAVRPGATVPLQFMRGGRVSWGGGGRTFGAPTETHGRYRTKSPQKGCVLRNVSPRPKGGGSKKAKNVEQ